MPYPYIGPGSNNSPYYYGGGGYKPQTPPRVAPSVQYGSPQPGRYDTPGPIKPAYGNQSPGGGGGGNPNQGNQNTTTAPPGQAPLDFSGLTYAHDPLLQSTILGGQNALGAARGRMLEAQKQLLLRFGSRQMAAKLLGNDPFVDTVTDDPYTSMSDLAQSRYTELRGIKDTNEEANANNGFYSTARAQSIADIARQRMQRDFTLEGTLQGQLTGLGDQYQTLENSVREQQAKAEQEAYARAIQQAILAYASGGAISSVPGGTGGTTTVPGGLAPQNMATGSPAQRFHENLLFGGY